METARAEASHIRVRRTVWSDVVFLTQVSRPGLWSTTALFYLMTLGHRDFVHSWTFWVGLFYIWVPLGLLLYGVTDIVDAEPDRFNPRKGTFLCGARVASWQVAAWLWPLRLGRSL